MIFHSVTFKHFMTRVVLGWEVAWELLVLLALIYIHIGLKVSGQCRIYALLDPLYYNCLSQEEPP